jgi:phosphoglycerol transferase MdoB-like AlkP superfamily enzyme
VDVWGITDLNLLQETHELLLEQKEPFFSLILTSGVHRPFTVPAGVEGFDYDVVPDKEFLDKYGFVPEEYLSMRFVDFALKRFFEEAEKSPYFENTIFIVTGDHGISERSPSAGENYMALRLNEFQVPLIIYAPALFPEGKVMPQAGGHTDLFPTIAGITGKTYQNTTMGRDLLDPSFGDDRLVFVRRSDVPPTLVRADFCYSMEWEGDGSIYTKAADSVREDWQKVENPDPEQIAEFKMLTESLWESARYISHFNTKREASEAN